MTDPVLVPRRQTSGLIVTWAFAALAAVAVGVLVEPGARSGWYAVGAGASLLVAFGANLWSGQAKGFIVRVAASSVGAVGVMGVVSGAFALGAIAG